MFCICTIWYELFLVLSHIKYAKKTETTKIKIAIHHLFVKNNHKCDQIIGTKSASNNQTSPISREKFAPHSG